VIVTFLQKSGALRTVGWKFLSLGCRPCGDWANTWLWRKCFTTFFSDRKQQQQQPHLLPKFLPYRNSLRSSY